MALSDLAASTEQIGIATLAMADSGLAVDLISIFYRRDRAKRLRESGHGSLPAESTIWKLAADQLTWELTDDTTWELGPE